MSRRSKLLLLIIVGCWLAVTMNHAVAQDGTAGVGVMAPFDATDSNGIRVSQYQLSTNEGGWMSDQDNKMLSLILKPCWEYYRWGVAILAYVVDATVGLQWVNTIAKPLESVSHLLRSKALEPMGLTSLHGGGVMGALIAVAVMIAAWRISRGQSGKGWTDIAIATVVAAAATGILAAPVGAVLGGEKGLATPLVTAQRYAIAGSNLIAGRPVPDVPIDTPAAAQQLSEDSTDRRVQNKDGSEAERIETGWSQTPVLGSMLIETFIRPVHQSINYGAVLDHDTECRPRYDEALKAGPYTDDANEIRDRIKDCANKDFYAYSDAPTNGWVTISGVFYTSVIFLAVMIGTFVVLLWLSILSLGWSTFKLSLTAVFAIVPGQARVGLVRSIVDVVVNLVYVVVGISMLSLVTVMIQEWLKSDAMILVKYGATDVMMLAGAVLMIVAWWQTRKTGTNFLRKFGGAAAESIKAGNPVVKGLGSMARTAIGTRMGGGRGGAAGGGGLTGAAKIARLAKIGGKVALHGSGVGSVLMAGTAMKALHAKSIAGQHKAVAMANGLKGGGMSKLFNEARGVTPEQPARDADAEPANHTPTPEPEPPARIPNEHTQPGSYVASTGSRRLDLAVAALGRRRGQLDAAQQHFTTGRRLKEATHLAKPQITTGAPLNDYLLRAAGRNTTRVAPYARAAGRGIAAGASAATHTAGHVGRGIATEARQTARRVAGPEKPALKPEARPTSHPTVTTLTGAVPTRTHRTTSQIAQKIRNVPPAAAVLQPTPASRASATAVVFGRDRSGVWKQQLKATR